MIKIVGLFLLSTLLYGVDIVDDFGEVIDTTDKIYKKGSIEYAITDNMNIMIKEEYHTQQAVKSTKISKFKVKDGYYIYEPEYVYQTSTRGLMLIPLINDDIEAILMQKKPILAVPRDSYEPIILDFKEGLWQQITDV